MRAFGAQVSAELRLSLRRGESLLIQAIVPVGFLLFFGSLVSLPGTGDGNTLDFLVPGVLGLAVMSTSLVSLGIATAYERFYGVLKRLSGAPLPTRTLLGAKTASILLIEAIQLVLLLIVARFGLGWQPRGSLPLAALALVSGSIAFAAIGLLMAGTLRAETTLALANGLYLVFLLVGGFAVSLDVLPTPLAAVARWLPAAALSTATRAALGGPGDYWASIALLAAWALAAGALAARYFRAE